MLFRIQMAIAAIALLSGVYFYWKHTIEQQALMEYNQRQMEQLVKDNQAYQEKLEAVTKQQQAIQEDMDKQNEQINVALKNLDDYLNSPEAKKQDRAASIILKNTINQLRGKTK